MVLLLYIILSVFIVSLVSIIGVIALGMKPKSLNQILFILVSFAAGAMLGAAFLDLIPEALSDGAADNVFIMVLAGIAFFFVIETFLYWYHCHSMRCERHSHIRGGHHHVKLPVTYLNLFGDGVHNFLDGVIIATGYLTSIPLGIVTTIAVLIHEIPQEIGDYGVLIYGGFGRGEALMYNFLSALVAVIGAIVAYYFATMVENITPWLVPFAAGGFIYIASVDLLPELHQEQKFKRAAIQFCFFIAGIVIIGVLTKYLGV